MNHLIKHREKAVAFVVARLGSTRLAAKHLRPIGDRLMLDWVVERLETCSEVDEIVITTVADPENEPLREYAQQRGIKCYWYEGDVEHVTNRLRCAAEAHQAEICILLSADSPLVHTPGIDLLIAELRSVPNAEIVGGHPTPGDRPAPLLSGVSVARTSCWQLADELSDTPDLKRHQFPVIRQQEKKFRVHNFALPEWYYRQGPRLSVDTWADLEFMNTVHDRLLAIGEEFNLSAVVKLCEREPEWAELNAHVKQRKTEENLQHVLFIVDVHDETSRLRFARSRELALQIIELKSWPVAFLVDDVAALKQIEDRGLTAHWGAIGRPSNQTPRGRDAAQLSGLSHSHQFIVLDLDPSRSLPSEWRRQLSDNSQVVALDHQGEWTLEAEHQWGLPDHAVLRRETKRSLRKAQRQARVAPWKTNDILTDLSNSDQLAAVRRFAHRNGLSLVEMSESTTHFDRELARSRVFLSRYNYGFHDALALETTPFAWVQTDSEERQLTEFSELHDLPPLGIRRESDLYLMHAALARTDRVKPAITDGSSSLIELLSDHLAQNSNEEAA
ncbi:MAG: spore coat polysaccharide biosynthesis protein SpsF (cytidylyltransferase family) [Planctomycetota bacterium]|jgi:spore coat polysaccharide biosynthesis protein SpsF (cytidylyltransferase family)